MLALYYATSALGIEPGPCPIKKIPA